MTAELLRMQAPQGLPRSNFFETVSDPLLPPQRIGEMLAHLPEEVYDKTHESHLIRLLKVILGDAGAGQVRKRYTYAHLSTFLATTHFHDLDRFFSGIFGLKRFIRETLDLDAYRDAATDAEWEAINAADASYRSRVMAFTDALSMAATPSGLAIAASAVLGDECRVYEVYEFDEMGVALPGVQTRLPNGGRNEFIVRPLRTIDAEEKFHLTRVLDRLKPADTLMTIDDAPATVTVPVPVTTASASSSYWHVQRKVWIEPEFAQYYPVYEKGVPVEQPKIAFSQYQGEAWNYNSSASVVSYVEDEDGNRVQESNFERFVDDRGRVNDYTPDLALKDPVSIMLGRHVSDGIMVTTAMDRGPA